MSVVNPVELNAFHWHEALDRGFTCAKLIDQLLLHHPVIKQNQQLQAKIMGAHKLLMEVCQEVATLSMDHTANE
jgi:hypothetical protein